MSDMSQEFEKTESSEILPRNFEDLTAREAAPIAERASKRLRIIHGSKNEHWNGVEQTLEGMAGWIRAKAGEVEGKTVRVIAGVVLSAELLSACSPGVSARPIETSSPSKPIATETFTPTQTVSPTPEPTKTPEVKTFPLCETPEKVLDCNIPPEALLDGSAIKYYKTLDWPDFDVSQLRFRKLVRFSGPNFDQIQYDLNTWPNYPKPETRPYQRLLYGQMKYGGFSYILGFVRYYEKGVDPKQYPWVVAVMNAGPTSQISDQLLVTDAGYYANKMNFPIYLSTDQFTSGTDILVPDPFATKVFQKYPDIQQRIDAFIAGDPTQLEGIPMPAIFENIVVGKNWAQ